MFSMTHPFLLQGHRGARGLAPENTLAGFAVALAIGVDAIELDVALTADGVAVVTHDVALNPDLTRGPDGRWLAAAGPAVCRLTRAELDRFDVGRLRPGSGAAALFPEQTPCDGADIPDLAAVFALTAGTGVIVDAEIKTAPDRPDATATPAAVVDAVLACAEAAGALDRLVLRSFDWRGLRHARRVAPAVPRICLTSRRTVAAARLWWDGMTPAAYGGSVPRAVAAEGAAAWAPEAASLDRAAIAEAHALGLAVLPWTVNDPADMARLIAWGVDGLCTDYPDRARMAMAAAGLALPPPRIITL
jgi:glycerophosphoryl diester phosphodiesterase